jgi:uncharacterized protein YndB with AHSA1/START domain
MKFVCLGYADQSQFTEAPVDQLQQMMNRCFDYDDELRRGGHFLGGEALGAAQDAVTLRRRNGNVDVTDGPFTETKEVLGGILLLEARDLNHAIDLMSKHPGVQFGPFEIRPADETVNRLIAQRDVATPGPCRISDPTGISITRVVSAPPAQVFRAWLDSDQLSHWWGPRSGRTDWTTPHVQIEPQLGGTFRTCIRSPEGQDYWARGTFREITAPRRLAFTHAWENDSHPASPARSVIVELTPCGDQTRLTFHIDGYDRSDVRDGEIEGWHECLDRLVLHFRDKH